ncbi:MAG: crossover junction endodeoxyribonuclease RuvC [Candidatus Eisenbacteria bacterium]
MRKRRNINRIAAIDPGIRALGFAILEGEKLLFGTVLTSGSERRGSGASRELLRSVSRLLAEWSPKTLVLERTPDARNRSLAPVYALSRAILRRARRRKLRTEEIAAATVRRVLLGDRKASKERMARYVASRYPALRPYLVPGNSGQGRHFQNLSDAIATGLCFLVQRERGDRRRDLSSELPIVRL